jgi:polygalacturonase
MSNEAARRDFIKHLAAGAAVALPASEVAFGAATESKNVAGKPFFNIADFGAVADGATLCTPAIQKAIDVCAQAGGGKVLVPSGRFLTNALFLKSNVHFEVLAGGTLAFTNDIASVGSVQGRWEGIDRTVYASLFNGQSLENTSITGRGTLEGQGKPWWEAYRQVRELRRKAGMGDEREPENPAGSPLKWGRPRMINLYDCKNVLISGLHIQNSPSWNIHPVRCEHVNIDGVTITAPADSPNTDGIDPDSCKDVRISNCYISVGDDCIIIKSGYRYREDGVPCENITVTNCVFGTGHCGVGIGSETSGGVKNVTVSNCICDGTDRGLRIKTARTRGNVVENFRASNVVMRDVGEAITVTMFYTGGDRHEAKAVDKFTPTFRNLHFSNISVNGAKQAILIEGLAEKPIRGISVNNFNAENAEVGLTCVNAIGASFSNLAIDSQKGPVFDVDTVTNLDLLRATTTKARESEPVVRLSNVSDAAVQLCSAPQGAKSLLELKGSANRNIAMIGNRSPAEQAVSFVDGATKAAITKES